LRKGRQSSHPESNSSVWKNEEDMEEQVYQPKGEDETTLHSIPLILHATLVLSLMKILLSLIRSHHFLSPAILIFM